MDPQLAIDTGREALYACLTLAAPVLVVGLVAGIYAADVGRAMRFARRVEAGQVFINGFLQGGDTVPFGGVKHSGIGREKGLSGLRAYLTEKSIVLSHGGQS